MKSGNREKDPDNGLSGKWFELNKTLSYLKRNQYI